MKMSIEEYKDAVRSCAKNHINYLFHNEGPDHARTILSNMFVNAHEHVRMASNRLTNSEIVGSDEYQKAILEFLDRNGTRLDIMLTHVPSEEETLRRGSLFTLLYFHPAYKDGRINIKDGHGMSFMDKTGNHINFCTADSNMYRIETDIEKWKAVANFNDSSKAKYLSEKFDSIFLTLSNFKMDDYFNHDGQ